MVCIIFLLDSARIDLSMPDFEKFDHECILKASRIRMYNPSLVIKLSKKVLLC